MTSRSFLITVEKKYREASFTHDACDQSQLPRPHFRRCVNKARQSQPRFHGSKWAENSRWSIIYAPRRGSNFHMIVFALLVNWNLVVVDGA